MKIEGHPPRRGGDKVEIVKLERDGLQTRVGIDERTVAEYVEAMEAGASFPAVTVYLDTAGKYYLADGFHRVEAAVRMGVKRILAHVVPGERIDALKHALGANADHGLRRTNEDKRRALEIAWENRQALFGGDPSQELLAKTCGVSRATAQRFMATLHPLQKLQVETSDEDGQPVSKLQVEATGLGDQPVSNVGVDETRNPLPPQRRIGIDGRVRTVPMPKRPAASGQPQPKHAPGVIVDRFGVEVPTAIRGAFTDVTLDEVAHHISVARSMIRRMKDEKNPAYMQLGDSASIELDNAFREVRFAKPYCVCRMCQGDGCKACGEAGFQTEAQYGNNPKEYKAEGATK